MEYIHKLGFIRTNVRMNNLYTGVELGYKLWGDKIKSLNSYVYEFNFDTLLVQIFLHSALFRRTCGATIRY